MQSSWLVPWDSRLDDLRWNKELGQQRLEPRADRAGAIVLFTQQPRGHHDVGINGPERYLQVLGGADSPVLSFAQGIFVANYDRRADLFTKLCKAVIRVRPQDKADIALGESLFDVRNSGGEKAVVTQIGVRIKRHRSKESNHRLAKFVAKLDRHIQSWVVQCPLGALHPVDYALSFWIRRSGFPHGDAGIETECFDFHPK